MKFKLIRYAYTLCLLSSSILFHTSCVNKEELQSEASIFFVPQSEKTFTRAFINGSEDINRFLVWGNYDGTPILNGTEVKKEGADWVYEPLQYWNMSATQYKFNAYTPTEAGTPSITSNTLSVSGVNSNAQVDLVMAYAQVTKENFRKVVNMKFHHALSAINFSFKLKEGFTYTNTYQVNNIQWSNVYTQGTFTMNGNTITSTPTGSLGKSLTLTEFTGNSFTVTSAMVSEDLLVIPQSTTSATLTFSLSINGISHEITKTVSIDWKPGTKYTYNITIDPYEITVETTPWDEPEMGDIIVVQ